jgi:hypothetical protein
MVATGRLTRGQDGASRYSSPGADTPERYRTRQQPSAGVLTGAMTPVCTPNQGVGPSAHQAPPSVERTSRMAQSDDAASVRAVKTGGPESAYRLA